MAFQATNHGRTDVDGTKIVSDVVPRTPPVSNFQNQLTNRERPHVPRIVANPDPEIENGGESEMDIRLVSGE